MSTTTERLDLKQLDIKIEAEGNENEGLEVYPELVADQKKEAESKHRETDIASSLDEARSHVEIEAIRAELGLKETESSDVATREYLQRYLEIEGEVAEKIFILEAKSLPDHFQEQYKFLNDDRLVKVLIAVVPDDLWVKGSQPSESHAERQLIVFKESYFRETEKPDEVAWMCHEFAHCKKALDSESEQAYFDDMRTSAYPDIASEYNYPNNLVEEYTFSEQFTFLRSRGISREQIITKMAEEYPDPLDQAFLNRVLDNVFNISQQEVEVETELTKRIGDILIKLETITPAEAEALANSDFDEFYNRFSRDFATIPESIPDSIKRKIRSSLGLEKPADIKQKEIEVEAMVAEMHSYLELLQQNFPYVRGIILYGSRMDKNKRPIKTSDIDITIIVDDGTETESGSSTVEQLVNYVNDHKTQMNNIEVGASHIDTMGEVDAVLKSSTDRAKLVWGWKPDVTRYIGDNLALSSGILDENAVNNYIRRYLLSDETTGLKRQQITENISRIKQTLGL